MPFPLGFRPTLRYNNECSQSTPTTLAYFNYKKANAVTKRRIRMGIYEKTEENALVAVYCNKCGKELKVTNNGVEEGVCSVTTQWGYFSNKDGEIHKFDLCEDCYDEFVKSFQIPAKVVEVNELI